MEISKVIEIQRQAALAGKLKNVSYRKELLVKLKSLLKSNEKELLQAVYDDFKKSNFDGFSSELAPVYHEIDLCLKNIDSWSKPQKVGSGIVNFPAQSYSLSEPYGHCLIIGAWNYPLQLTLVPLVDALCAGNVCLIKPSEMTEKSSQITAQLINQNFSAEDIYVIEGGVEVSQELLSNKFDKIFFTGSTAVGKIVAEAAAKHLTPVTLELGGKSPCVVLADADLDVTAKRIVWGKFLNAGQTCIAPDYVLADEKIYDALLEKLKEQTLKQHGENPIESTSYPRIINSKHVLRLMKLIPMAKIFHGAQFNKEKNYISPTILKDVTFEDEIMKDEIFGPILPVIKMTNLQESINVIKRRPKPLAFYLFTKNQILEKQILNDVSFGGGCVNDVIMHITNSNLPFGGVGESGMGNYHGEYGFQCFSHKKSILKKSFGFEPPVKYAPYTDWKYKILRFLYKS